MQRTWATRTDHDDVPLAWLAQFDKHAELARVTDALTAALADEATIGACQTGLLAVECIAYLRGGDADLHPQLHDWLYRARPRIDDATRDLALAVIARVRETSRLAAWWRDAAGDGHARWLGALDHLAERLRAGQRMADVAQPSPEEIAALGADMARAIPHLRVGLVPRAIDPADGTEAKLVAPGISLVLHYEVEGKEPVAVPRAHVEGWGRAARNLWKHAAKSTRTAATLRIHIIEAEHHEVSVVFGSDTFTAGMAPFVDLFLDGPAPYGVLMGIPFAGGFVFHRIVDGSWREAARDVIEHIDRLFESEEPISRDLFWWRDGALSVQPYAKVGDEIVITGTPELLAAAGALDDAAPVARTAPATPKPRTKATQRRKK